MLQFYNSLTQKKEIFQPLEPDHVRMYACGPTVYDHIHVGNARPIVVFDVVFRLLQAFYPRVTYVRNITDVDDKILIRAQERGISPQTLTQETTELLFQDIQPLNVLEPTHQPRATEYIPHMIAMIAALIAHGHAYCADGHVLFDIQSDALYGTLSRCDEAEMHAGARVEIASYKKNPGDFVLWKPSSSDLMGWESPWGYGRPGWHIECSAMSRELLGVQFDLHGGGLDLKFPHHENEMAQSRCAHEGATMAHMWMHNGLITISGQKMSKSLGHFVMLQQALRQYQGSVIRYFFLNTHYRHTLDWSNPLLDAAQASLNRLYLALRPYTSLLEDLPLLLSDEDAPFLDALCDDLNTPYALHLLHQWASTLNRKEGQDMEKVAHRLWRCGSFLGIFSENVTAWFQRGQGQERDAIEDLIQKRHDARARKDFKTADVLRDRLHDLGVVIEDRDGHTEWRFELSRATSQLS